jgi:hypothetical protein
MAQIILDSNNNLIQGDFDNATLNNRTKLQTTTTNATTNVYVVPNGSATSAGVSVANNSSLTNASKIVMATNGTTDTQIISGINGSGTYLPMSFYTNNALAGQFTTAGNLTVTGTITSGSGTVMVNGPAFSATKNVSQSISNSTFTKVTYQVEDYDTNNNFASSTFTPTVTGYYIIGAGFNAAAGGVPSRVILDIYKNGNQIKRLFDVSARADNVSGSCLLYLNGTTDYIEVYAYITATSPSIYGVSADTFFTGAMIRSA